MSPLIVCSLLALLLMVPRTSAYQADAYHAMLKDNAYPGKCVVNSPDGSVLVIGSEENANYPGRCAEIMCGRHSWALVYTCKTKYPPKGCKFGPPIDKNASFPDCCRRRLECHMG